MQQFTKAPAVDRSKLSMREPPFLGTQMPRLKLLGAGLAIVCCTIYHQHSPKSSAIILEFYLELANEKGLYIKKDQWKLKLKRIP
jgi:hypothetical protein